MATHRRSAVSVRWLPYLSVSRSHSRLPFCAIFVHISPTASIYAPYARNISVCLAISPWYAIIRLVPGDLHESILVTTVVCAALCRLQAICSFVLRHVRSRSDCRRFSWSSAILARFADKPAYKFIRFGRFAGILRQIRSCGRFAGVLSRFVYGLLFCSRPHGMNP